MFDFCSFIDIKNMKTWDNVYLLFYEQ